MGEKLTSNGYKNRKMVDGDPRKRYRLEMRVERRLAPSYTYTNITFIRYSNSRLWLLLQHKWYSEMAFDFGNVQESELFDQWEEEAR